MPSIYSPVRSFPVIHRSKTSTRKRTQEKLILGVAAVALFLSVGGLAVTGFVFAMECSNKIVTEEKTEAPIVCVPCEKLSLSESSHSDPLFEKLTVTDNGVNCCAKNSEQMSALLELIMRRQEVQQDPLPKFNASNFMFSPASAHKRLKASVIKNLTHPEFQSKRLVKTNFSQENEPVLEHARNVDVLDQALRIKHTGLYYVYSSVHFRPDSVYPCKSFTYKTWGHYVEKITPNYPGRSGCILKTSHTCCDECIGDSETSFTSGVFYLSEGDMIQISISGHGLVRFQSQSSFAGLMMLGSSEQDETKNQFFH